MTTQSINQLRENRDHIRRSLRKFRVSKFTEKYGQEQEYTAQGIRAGIEAILVDVNALVKAPARLIQNSTLDERNHVISWLGNLNTYIESEDLPSIASAIDQIKPYLRNFGVRYSDERMNAFDEFVNSLQKNASEISQRIVDIEAIRTEASDLQEKIKTSSENLENKLEVLVTNKESLVESIRATEAEREKLSDLVQQDSDRSEQIKELLASSKGHEKLIDSFSKNVANRETQLKNQEVATDNYTKSLKSFREEHKRILAEGNELIENSRHALEYATAQGLSSAFTEQYKTANDSKQRNGWLKGAGVFLAAAVCIGIWLTVGGSLGLGVIIGRISLISILIAGAWFCAGQYVKQRNIAEDYAYKAVLAKSIMGFSEELSTESSKGEEHSIFMKLALSEMLKNPLRKHSREASTISETLNRVTDLFKIKSPE